MFQYKWFHLFFFLLLRLVIVTSFAPTNDRAGLPSSLRPKYCRIFSSANEEEDSENDGDEDEIPVKAYRNRSMAWTLRYRKLNPYEVARARVIGFGHRSKEDWDEAVSSGQLGQYVPNYPDEMYAPEWESWDEFLGLMRSYEETKSIATSLLGLKSLDDYLIFIKCNAKRAEGLRIPVRPDLYYDEWIDEVSFFGKRDEEEPTIDYDQSFQ